MILRLLPCCVRLHFFQALPFLIAYLADFAVQLALIDFPIQVSFDLDPYCSPSEINEGSAY